MAISNQQHFLIILPCVGFSYLNIFGTPMTTIELAQVGNA